MNGQVDLDKVLPETPENKARREAALAFDKATRAKMSPKGKLGLPPLLDQRRLEWGMVDGIFKIAAVYDRVLVWQIPEHKGETFIEGGNIIAPDQTRDRLKHECPRGIVVGAGLRALDILRSHGLDLGHLVYFINSQPWRIFVDEVLGKRIAILPMNAGDLLGGETLRNDLREGRARVVRQQNEAGVTEHRLEDIEGHTWDPVQPWVSDDMP